LVNLIRQVVAAAEKLPSQQKYITRGFVAMIEIKSKTTLSIIVAALLVFIAFSPGSAAAAEGFKVLASKTEGGAGGQVTLNVTAEKAKGTEGGQFTLVFDQSLVKPISIEAGDLVLSAEGNLYMANLDYAPGKLMFMWVTANADTANSGVICRITFDLLKEGTAVVTFEDLIVVAGTDGEVSSAPGQIKVGAPAPGQGTIDEPDEQDNGGGEEAGTEDGNGEGEEAFGDDNNDQENQEESLTDQGSGISPILVVIPIIIIVALALAYYLIRKTGKKEKNNR
jgi:hypothetical protein